MSNPLLQTTHFRGTICSDAVSLIQSIHLNVPNCDEVSKDDTHPIQPENGIGCKKPNHSILLFLKKESTVFWDSSCFKFPMPPRVFFKPFRCSWLFTAFTTSDKFRSFGIGGISAAVGEIESDCCRVAEPGEACVVEEGSRFEDSFEVERLCL